MPHTEPSTRPTATVTAAAVMAGYGSLVYLVFLATFAYTVVWVEALRVPRTIDSGPAASTATAIVVDVALLSVFMVQHSVMARPGFKRVWTRWVPAPMERSTYVLAATAALALVMWQWRPLPTVVWQSHPTPIRAAIYLVSLAGWALVLFATFAIDHFELFGLLQVFTRLAGKASVAPQFQIPAVYRAVRHPLYLGFLIAFWTAPTMTTGRLLFAAVTTTYILVAVRFEEHDLIALFGDRYRDYRKTVPMLLPRPRQSRNRNSPGQPR